MNTETQYPFTKDQFDVLNPEGKQAIEAVAEFLTGFTVREDQHLTSETLSEALNLLKPSEGRVPCEYADEDLLRTIRRKFSAVYEIGLELAEAELVTKGLKLCEDFNFCLVIEASHDDCTHIAILDFKRPSLCYLHEWTKAWNFHFATLQALADDVLRVKRLLVEQVMAAVKTRKLIHIVLEGGVIHQVLNIPPGVQVQFINLDVEGLRQEERQPSPLDGHAAIHQHI